MNSTCELGDDAARALKPYPAYKDSGIEWLGRVPAHWEVRHLGRIGRFFKGGGGTKEDEREEGIPCVRYGDLYTHHRFFITASRACVAPDLAATAYTPIAYGDVLFAGSGETMEEIGKSAVNLIRGPACCGGDVIVFRPSIDAEARFLGYIADCSASVHQKACIGRGFTVMHIYSSDLKYMIVAIPPVSEQAAIVRFLDHADRRIRRYIRAKQQLITLLEEQKQAIIHQAVTGQIDIRTGKPYQAYHDSRVEWLGAVPEHWEVRPLCAVGSPKSITGQQHLQLLSVYLDRGVIRFSEAEEKRTNVTSEDLTKYQVVAPSDFVLNNQQAWRGSVGVSNYCGIVSPAYLVLSLSRKLISPFANLLFRDQVMVTQYVVCSRGVGTIQRNLYWPHLRRAVCPLPPLAEQTAIASYLDRADWRIRGCIQSEQRQIELLNEYRTRLIADVVTGKLDVREAAARLPDEADELEPLDEAETLIDGEEEPTDVLATAP